MGDDNQEAGEMPKFIPMSIYPKPLRDDIVGQAGTFVDDFILAMKSESIYNRMAVSPDKTFLITGKPGTGKTIGINALVNQINNERYLGWLEGEKMKPQLFGMEYDIGKYGTAYINMGSKIAQGFFDRCYRMSTIAPVLVIFDEAEVLFGSRANNHSHKEDSKLLDTIMKNMQTLHDRDNMYAVMMSNFPDAFDSASIRAGRVDRRYEFKLPDQTERDFAYEHTIRRLNEKAGYKVVRGYDTADLATLSREFSYADIVESVNGAVKKRAQQISKTRKKGTIPSGYISQKRLEDAVNSHKSAFHSSKRSIGFT